MSRADFGAYTRKLRLRAGLSQLQVAEKLDFKSGQLVSNWERGACYPPLDDLRELAALYKVDFKKFFDKYCFHTKQDDWNRLNRD